MPSSQPTTPASGLALFCGALPSGVHAFGPRVGSNAQCNNFFAAHLSLQMLTVDLERLSFWEWDSACLTPEDLVVHPLRHVHMYARTQPFTQAPISSHAQEALLQWGSPHPRQISSQKKPRSPSLPLHCLCIGLGQTKFKLKQTKLTLLSFLKIRYF